MSRTLQEKKKLLNRTRRIIGQAAAIERFSIKKKPRWWFWEVRFHN